MPNTGTGSTIDVEEGFTHLIECTGRRRTGNGCSHGFLPGFSKIPKDFVNRSFLCGSCAAAKVAVLQSKHSIIVKQPRICERLNVVGSIETV